MRQKNSDGGMMQEERKASRAGGGGGGGGLDFAPFAFGGGGEVDIMELLDGAIESGRQALSRERAEESDCGCF